MTAVDIGMTSAGSFAADQERSAVAKIACTTACHSYSPSGVSSTDSPSPNRF
jgi:hypothetical protein